MSDRRRVQRLRSYLGGRVVFGHGACSADCLVRNISPQGARLDFEGIVPLLPDRFDLFIPRQNKTWRAATVWRQPGALGVSLMEKVVPVSLAQERRIRALTREIDALRRRETTGE